MDPIPLQNINNPTDTTESSSSSFSPHQHHSTHSFFLSLYLSLTADTLDPPPHPNSNSFSTMVANNPRRRLNQSDELNSLDNPDEHLLTTPQGDLNDPNHYYCGFLPKNDADMLQGVPFGLAFGTLPFILKQKLSFSDMAVFSLAGYPYSLKLLWSPIVDSVFFKAIGRRKSWIIPIQIMSGFTFYGLSQTIDAMFAAETINVYSMTTIWFFVIFLCATQDIAVDGWALTLLSRENMQFASTCQTVGINIGYFLSFTIFLAFNSADFCNKYIRSVPSDIGLLQIGPYLYFWSLCYFGLTIWVAFFKRENEEENEQDVTIVSTYRTIYNIIKLPHMLRFIAVLLLAKVAFIANESVTALKLLEKGILKEDLALAVLIDFPFQIVFGYVAAQWSSGKRPLKPWLAAQVGRLVIALVSVGVVYIYPSTGVTQSYFVLVIFVMVLGSFTSTVQFVSLGAFFAHVADPVIGGTYMTLLNTLSNLGGTWPRFFVLEAVDWLTKATCTGKDGVVGQMCRTDIEKAACKNLGGTCLVERDGYYIMGIASIFIGIVLLLQLIRPEVRVLEALPLSMWKVNKSGTYNRVSS